MLTLIAVLVVVVCLLLILAVLIQNPKEGGIDASLGGNISNQIFGVSQSADGIERWTWYLGGALFLLCIIAAIISAKG